MSGGKSSSTIIILCVTSVVALTLCAVLIGLRGASPDTGNSGTSGPEGTTSLPVPDSSSVPSGDTSATVTADGSTEASRTEEPTSAAISSATPSDPGTTSPVTEDNPLSTAFETESSSPNTSAAPPETSSEPEGATTSEETSQYEITTIPGTDTLPETTPEATTSADITTGAETVSPPVTTAAPPVTTSAPPVTTSPPPVTVSPPPVTTSPETTSSGPWRPDPETTIPVPSLKNGEERPDTLIAPNGDEVIGKWIRSGDEIWFAVSLPFELGMFESGKWWSFHPDYCVLEYGTYTRVGASYIGFRADNPLPAYDEGNTVHEIIVSDTVEPGSWW